MTDIFLPGFTYLFRVVPSRPNYAISKNAEILSIRSNAVLVPEEGTFVVHERIERPGYVRTSDIDVRVFMAEVFPEVDYPKFKETNDRWRNVGIVGSDKEFEVNRDGWVREVGSEDPITPVWNPMRHAYLVHVMINGALVHLDGPKLASIAWGKSAQEI